MAAVKFKKVGFRNFLSYGNAWNWFPLENNGITLMLGENVDVGDAGSRNGVGKTAALQALFVGLYNNNLTSIKKDNLINATNKKNMEVVVEFEKDGLDYKIHRGRKPDILSFMRKPCAVEEWDEKVHDITGSIKETDKQLEEVLGIRADLFRYVVLFTATNTPFLELSGPDQRTIIERLFDMDVITAKAAAASDLKKEIKKELDLEIFKVKSAKENNERIAESITKAKAQESQWEIDNAVLVEMTAKNIEQLQEIDFEGQEKVHKDIAEAEKAVTANQAEITEHTNSMNRIEGDIKSNKTELVALAKQEKEVNDIDFDAQEALHADKEQIQGEIDAVSADITKHAQYAKDAQKLYSDLETKLKKHDEQIAHLEDDNCPFCLQNMPNAKEKIAEIGDKKKEDAMQALTAQTQTMEAKDNVAQLTTTKEGFDAQLAEVKSKLLHPNLKDLLTLKNLKNSIEEKQKNIFEKIQELEAENSKVGATLEKNQKLKTELEENFLNLKNLAVHESLVKLTELKTQLAGLIEKQAELGNAKNPHTDTIKDLEANSIKKVDGSKVDELESELKHADFLLKLLNDKNSFIRKRIIGTVLPFMNKRLMYYLSELGLPHRVEFENNLTVSISQFGRELNFGNLSTGERQRVNLALSFTFREVLSAMHTSFNILLLDEILDAGLDTIGVENTLKLLKQMAKDKEIAIFLISHREEVSSRVNKTILIKKESGFSSILGDGDGI